jgi:hypothetical protein
LTGFAGGRPEPQPVIRLFSFLVDKSGIPVSVAMDGRKSDVPIHIPSAGAGTSPAMSERTRTSPVAGALSEVPLIAIAHGRSGDKGDIANIGVLARRPEFVDTLRRELTADAVGGYLAHYAKGKVERFEWPGLDGFNFLLHEGLGGGGIASLRHDPQGKAMAQVLMDMPVHVPAAWLDRDGPLAGWATGGVA